MCYYKKLYYIVKPVFIFILSGSCSQTINATDIHLYVDHSLVAPLIVQDDVYTSVIRSDTENINALVRVQKKSQLINAESNCSFDIVDDASLVYRPVKMGEKVSVNLNDRYPFFSNTVDKAEESVQTSNGLMIPSKPVTIDYATGLTAQRYLLLTTNQGVLYLYKQEPDGLSNIWTFHEPASLSKSDISQPVVTTLRLTPPITLFLDDKNKNGIVDRALNEHVYGFVGFINSTTYYAIDFTDPEHPSLMWVADKAHESALSRLGYPVDSPVITLLKLSEDGDEVPVVILSGGIMHTHDKAETGDGKGIYILNAFTGAVIASFSPDSDSLSNISTPFPHSIAAKV